MAIVSISEAARLTGKDRRTIQRHITAGKLSRAAGSKGIYTAELLRVYGAFIAAPAAPLQDAIMPQETAPAVAPAADHEKEALKAENDKLKALLEAKQETIDSLNRALLLLEHKTPTNLQLQEEKPQEAHKKSFWGWFKNRF